MGKCSLWAVCSQSTVKFRIFRTENEFSEALVNIKNIAAPRSNHLTLDDSLAEYAKSAYELTAIPSKLKRSNTDITSERMINDDLR